MNYKNELIKVIKEHFKKEDIELNCSDLDEKLDIVQTLSNGLLTDFYEFFNLDYKTLFSSIIFLDLEKTLEELSVLDYIAKGYSKGLRFDKEQMDFLKELINKLNNVKIYYENEKEKRIDEYNKQKDVILRSNSLEERINDDEIVTDVDLFEEFIHKDNVPLDVKRNFMIFINKHNSTLIDNNIKKVPRIVKVDINKLEGKRLIKASETKLQEAN